MFQRLANVYFCDRFKFENKTQVIFRIVHRNSSLCVKKQNGTNVIGKKEPLECVTAAWEAQINVCWQAGTSQWTAKRLVRLTFLFFLGGKEPKQYGIRWAGIGFSLAVRRFSTVVVKNNDCAVDPRGLVCCAARSKGYVRVERDGGKVARKKPVNERIVRKRET